MSASLLAISLAMVFVAGLIRGFTGFGFSIAAVPLLSLVVPPAQAVPVVLLLQLLVSLSGLRDAVDVCDWRSVRILSLGAVIATPLGAWGLAHLPAAPVRLSIAAIVGIAVVVLAYGRGLSSAPGAAGAFGCGIVSGLFNGLGGMPGPPIIAFYLASPIATSIGRASMIVFFLVTSIVALVPLAMLGLVTWPMLAAAAAGFPAVWVGSWLGGRLYRSSPERYYRAVALSLLVVTAVLAAIRSAFDFA